MNSNYRGFQRELEKNVRLQRASNAERIQAAEKATAARKHAMEDELFNIERRRDKRESRLWIWNTINTVIAAAALIVSVIALFQ